MLQDVLQQIEQRDRFVLTSHARPDGDAIGSALACCQVLRAMGKQADVVLHDGVPRIYRGLPFADQVRQANRVAGNYEAATVSYTHLCPVRCYRKRQSPRRGMRCPRFAAPGACRLTC